ncbi:acetylornithine deacetylase, partial [Candidatus Parvarchaeota archaeon]|nr:acetylornithine deacetylase [Candidatus Parvarchaeota archaeon]
MDHIEFLDKLVQTPSPSFKEQEVAKLCEEYLKQFPFEKVWIDEVGNSVATNYKPTKGVNPDLL